MQALDAFEIQVVLVIQWLKLAVELVGVVLVAAGVMLAVIQLLRMVARRRPFEFTGVRLTLARYLALALEFELGADVLGTAVSPDWDHIGKLGAVAVIRTGLNFFLSKEIRDERQRQDSACHNSQPEGSGDRAGPVSTQRIEQT